MKKPLTAERSKAFGYTDLSLFVLKQAYFCSVDRLVVLFLGFSKLFLYAFKMREKICILAVDSVFYRSFLHGNSYRICRFVDRLECSCAGYASARTRHSFQQVPIVFACSRLLHHFLAFIKALGFYYFDLTFRIDSCELFESQDKVNIALDCASARLVLLG